MIERAKSFIKSAFPGGGPLWRRLRGFRQTNIPEPNLEKTFTEIYLKNSWADPESVSGRGSTLARTEAIRQALPDLLASVGAQSLIDAACGDLNWMRHTDLRGVEYLGVDIVADLIAANQLRHSRTGRRFVVLDITRDCLPKADVILCRDTFIHLSFRDAGAALANFKQSGAALLLATTHFNVRENTDVQSGGWRSVNLELPPYSFPEPLQLLVEDPQLGKGLGLWRLGDLKGQYRER